MRACREQRLLSPLAESRVRHLCQRGLSLEQGLVGTGLMTAERYAEVLSQIVGLPYAEASTVESSSEDLETLFSEQMRREYGFHPLFKDEAEVSVAFATPEAQETVKFIRRYLQKVHLRLQPFFMLQTDWHRLYPTSRTELRLGAWLRAHLRHASEEGVAHVVVRTHQGSVVILHEGRPLVVRELTPISEQAFPAIRLLMHRLTRGGAWIIERDIPERSEVSLLRQDQAVRNHVFHLTKLSETGDDEAEQGITLLLDADPYTKMRIAAERSQDVGATRWYATPTTFAEAEEASHAVLAGSSGMVFLTGRMFDETRALWHALQEAAIPFRMIRVHRLPEGEMAWESLPQLV